MINKKLITTPQERKSKMKTSNWNKRAQTATMGGYDWEEEEYYPSDFFFEHKLKEDAKKAKNSSWLFEATKEIMK